MKDLIKKQGNMIRRQTGMNLVTEKKKYINLITEKMGS